MPFVDPLMFRSVTVLDFRGLTVKLWKFPLLSISNPTEVPEFEMPFWFVPAAALVPAFGPLKFVKV